MARTTQSSHTECTEDAQEPVAVSPSWGTWEAAAAEGGPLMERYGKVLFAACPVTRTHVTGSLCASNSRDRDTLLAVTFSSLHYDFITQRCASCDELGHKLFFLTSTIRTSVEDHCRKGTVMLRQRYTFSEGLLFYKVRVAQYERFSSLTS